MTKIDLEWRCSKCNRRTHFDAFGNWLGCCPGGSFVQRVAPRPHLPAAPSWSPYQ